MPSFMIEQDLSEKVSQYLKQALPEAYVGDLQLNENLPSVLILKINQIFAAFAFGKDDESYGTTYSAFKTFFRTKGEDFNSLDVAFVFCLPLSAPPKESFRSQIETDVYFCRKFVLTLGQDVSTSLSGLPFLPLSPVQGTSLRPPSAQSLLLRSGIRAELAKSLIVPYARGVQSIITDCLEKKFGDPHGLGHSVLDTQESRDTTDRSTTILQSMTIKNFRAYRKSKTFNFGSAITILYGPNGFGKTSFFDALDFVVTGGVGRLKSASTDHALVKVSKHLDSGDEESVVSLQFKRGDKTHNVTRYLTKASQATLDDKTEASRKDVLTLLTGSGDATSDRVDNLISLFRATHLFSQEDQELTKNFQEKCELPADLVSRMLAFDDYVRGLNKTAEIQRILEGLVKDTNVEIKRLEGSVAKDSGELARLEKVSAVGANPNAIEVELKILRKDVSELGIEVPKDDIQIDIAVIRGWRAQLESRIGDADSRGKQLSVVADDLQRLRRLQQELVTVQDSLKQSDDSLLEAELQRAAAEASHRVAIQDLSQAKVSEAGAQRLMSLFAWREEKQPEYVNLVERLDSLTKTLQEVSQSGIQLINQDSSADLNRQSSEEVLRDLVNRITTQTERLQVLHTLNRQRTEVDAANERLLELGEVEIDLIDTISTSRDQLELTSSAVTQARAEEATLDAKIAALEAESTEVKSLLTQLRGHVTEGTCLLCGEDHGSKDNLLSKIDQRLSQEGPLSEAQARVVQKRVEIAHMTDTEASHRAALENTLSRHNTLRSEREKSEKLVLEFSQRIASLGLTSLEDLNLAIQHAHQALALLETERDAAAQARDLAAVAHDSARAAVSANAFSLASIKSTLDDTNQALKLLLAEAHRRNMPLDVDPHELQSHMTQAKNNLETTKQASQKAHTLLDQLSIDFGRKTQDSETLRKIIVERQGRAGRLTREISDIAASLARFDLSVESTDEAVTKLVLVNSARLVRMQATKDRARSLEMALDAATTSAVLDALRSMVKQNVDLIKKEKLKRESYEPWIKYFRSIEDLLDKQRNSATQNFTREYGPRTAVLQRRLRPVYGFGNIEVTSHDGAITVNVFRNGEAMRPTDYFSQSQVQTLLLGLFLTASSSQTWSTFSSVMMDDPVTHFDDLNTYALLDLISGLVQSSDSSRQFVISTCDEKLLQLARQKFRHLNDRAKFYRFSAIGSEGPLVMEIPGQ
jgi:DNA repair protein SbcC/Rad50